MKIFIHISVIFEIYNLAGMKQNYSNSNNVSEEPNEEPGLFTEENMSYSNEKDFSKQEMIKLIRKNINVAIADKHNTSDESYKIFQVETLISNKNCHLTTVFHDFNLNQIDEFLKR